MTVSKEVRGRGERITYSRITFWPKSKQSRQGNRNCWCEIWVSSEQMSGLGEGLSSVNQGYFLVPHRLRSCSTFLFKLWVLEPNSLGPRLRPTGLVFGEWLGPGRQDLLALQGQGVRGYCHPNCGRFARCCAAHRLAKVRARIVRRVAPSCVLLPGWQVAPQSQGAVDGPRVSWQL